MKYKGLGISCGPAGCWRGRLVWVAMLGLLLMLLFVHLIPPSPAMPCACLRPDDAPGWSALLRLLHPTLAALAPPHARHLGSLGAWILLIMRMPVLLALLLMPCPAPSTCAAPPAGGSAGGGGGPPRRQGAVPRAGAAGAHRAQPGQAGGGHSARARGAAAPVNRGEEACMGRPSLWVWACGLWAL